MPGWALALKEFMKRFEYLDKFRVKSGLFSSPLSAPYGFFFIPIKIGQTPVKVMCSPFDGENEWEHVSVSLPARCPTWNEMCFIKELFWGHEDTVIQFHPPRSEYVNNHEFCLHLWRNTKIKIDTPPSHMVGVKNLEGLA